MCILVLRVLLTVVLLVEQLLVSWGSQCACWGSLFDCLSLNGEILANAQIEDAEVHKPDKKKATEKATVEALEQQVGKAKGGKGGGPPSKPSHDKHASVKNVKKVDKSECPSQSFISANTYCYC